MPDRRTIVERLHRPNQQYGSERSELIESILYNLSEVFCSFPGSMKAELPTDRVRLGMPTLGVTIHPMFIGRAQDGPQGAELRDDLPTRIRNLVRVFEPRLRAESVVVEVRSDPTRPGCLEVALSATMRSGRQDLGAFRMDASLTADGHLFVENS